MHEETMNYIAGSVRSVGRLYYRLQNTHPLPAIIVVHAFQGQDHFAREKAQELAQMGYIGFAADLYGDGKSVSREEAPSLMTPLFLNRTELRARIVAAYEAVKLNPKVDPHSIGVIGFCFGGLTAIELFRSGVNLKGAVAFHALLSSKMGGQTAQTVPIAKKPQGSLLVLHGYQDPLSSPQDITDFQTEMNAQGVDWQMNIYGKASHAFTNPEVNDPKSGLIYHHQTATRAWEAMRDFFMEVFRK